MLPISFLYSLALSLPALPSPPAPGAPLDGHVTLVRAERLILSPGEELAHGAMLIEDGRILAVGADLEAPEGAKVLTGKVACAGFIDSWSSLGVDPGSLKDMAIAPFTRTSDAIDPWYRPDIISEALRGGVTSARVQAGMMAPMSGIGSVIRFNSQGSHVVLDDACLGATIGITRGRASDIFDRIAEVDRLGGLIDKGNAYLEEQTEYKHELAEWEKEIAEQEKELEEDFKKAKKKRDKDLEKAKEDDKEYKEKRYKEDKKPKKPKYDANSEVMARVANGELALVVEIHRSAEIRRLLERTDSFDRLRLILAGATESLDHVDALRERRIPVILWPAPLGRGVRGEYSEHDLALAGELSRAGVKVLLGSGGNEHARELRMLAGLAVSNGMEREAALAAITTRPARAFDLSDRIGRLSPGMEADVLVFDGDPLDTTSTLLHCLSKGEVVNE